jgi:ribosomal protein S18 acetylase RimI-like enzyme
MTSPAWPHSVVERVALVIVGGVLGLSVQYLARKWKRRNTRNVRSTLLPTSRFEVVRMNTDDEGARSFVLEGYQDIQRAEGKEASEEELQFVRSGLDAMTNSGDNGVLLCLLDGRRVGYLWHVLADACQFGPGCYAKHDGRYTWVHTVYTHPSMRHRGVARTLYAHLEGRMQQQIQRSGAETGEQEACREIWLDVFENNPQSIRLHRKLGFQPVTTIYRKGVGSAESIEN